MQTILLRTQPTTTRSYCDCCGSREQFHDKEACKAAAYAAFDAWRTEMMHADKWHGVPVDIAAIEAEALREMEQELEPVGDLLMRDVCPANGLY